jgi:hypothetical protein
VIQPTWNEQLRLERFKVFQQQSKRIKVTDLSGTDILQADPPTPTPDRDPHDVTREQVLAQYGWDGFGVAVHGGFTFL